MHWLDPVNWKKKGSAAILKHLLPNLTIQWGGFGWACTRQPWTKIETEDTGLCLSLLFTSAEWRCLHAISSYSNFSVALYPPCFFTFLSSPHVILLIMPFIASHTRGRRFKTMGHTQIYVYPFLLLWTITLAQMIICKCLSEMTNPVHAYDKLMRSNLWVQFI